MRKTYSSFLLAFTAAFLTWGCEPAAETDSVPSLPRMDVPAAAGSQSPNLASGPNGVLALSWLQPDETGHALLYSVLEGSAWSEPVPVARGDNWFVNWADFPSVVPLADDLWAAHWLVQQPAGGYAYDVLFATSVDGAAWSEPLMPHDDGTPTEHGFVTLFPQESGAGLIWLDGRNTAVASHADPGAHGMTLRSATWAPDGRFTNENVVDDLVCDCCQTDVAVSDEAVVAVYRDRTREETRDIYVTRQVDGAWQAAMPVAPDGWTIPGCPVNGPVIGAEGRNLAVAWYTAAADQPKVRVARSKDFGETFAAPLDVADGEVFGRAGLAMLPDGDVAVSWLCKGSDDRARVCLRGISADDSKGPVVILSGDQHIPPLSVPQLARSGTFLVAAWTFLDDSGSHIATSLVPIESLLR